MTVTASHILVSRILDGHLISCRHLSYPVQIVGDLHVDAGDAILTAPDAPAHQAYHLECAATLTHQGTAAVTLKRKRDVRWNEKLALKITKNYWR